MGLPLYAESWDIQEDTGPQTWDIGSKETSWGFMFKNWEDFFSLCSQYGAVPLLAGQRLNTARRTIDLIFTILNAGREVSYQEVVGFFQPHTSEDNIFTFQSQ